MIPHPVQRAQERLGVANGWGVVDRLRDAVLKGRAKCEGSAHGWRSKWRAKLDGRWVRFVWQEDAQRVITVLGAKPRRPALSDRERRRTGKDWRKRRWHGPDK